MLPAIEAAHSIEQNSARPAAADYRIVKQAIEFVSTNWQEQPGLEEIARHVGLSQRRLHELFTRWAGLTPKAFLQAITLDRARGMLRGSNSVLEAALESGLSGTGRLHDLFVQHEAMTPGTWKSGAAGLEIAYGFHDSPFGTALIMVTDKGVCGLAFADEKAQEMAILRDMQRRWPNARYTYAPKRTHPHAARIFNPLLWRAREPLRIIMIGTDFEIRVWETLMQTPFGRMTTYSELAKKAGAAGAARAVGRAVGRNPLSFVVPCHRVVRSDGGLGGYHWGLTRKRALIGWEKGLSAGTV